MFRKYLEIFDSLFIDTMRQYGFVLLRVTLAIVFLWFGTLKVINASPVHDLIVSTYPSFPEPFFIVFLGVWEIVIGVGLLCKIFLRVTLALLWLQMAGIFIGFFLAPSAYFFSHNPFLLSGNGEFVIKNFVLLAASIVIGGNEISLKNKHKKN